MADSSKLVKVIMEANNSNVELDCKAKLYGRYISCETKDEQIHFTVSIFGQELKDLESYLFLYLANFDGEMYVIDLTKTDYLLGYRKMLLAKLLPDVKDFLNIFGISLEFKEDKQWSLPEIFKDSKLKFSESFKKKVEANDDQDSLKSNDTSIDKKRKCNNVEMDNLKKNRNIDKHET